VGRGCADAVAPAPSRSGAERRAGGARQALGRDGVRAARPDRARRLMPHDRPTPAELAEATREFLESEVLPLVEDHRLKFRTLVAINALGILQRELVAEETGPSEEELSELAERIRAGDPPDDALAILKEHVAAKVRVLNPRYLKRYR